MYREQQGITDKSVDEVAQEEARKMADELGVPYKGHITKLTRPANLHNARVVYVDGTGSFNPSTVEGLPPGFVISRRFMTPQQARTETSIAMSIAFGDHGFGRKFSPQEPLMLIAVGGDTVTAQQLQEELEGLIGDHPVKIDAWQATV